MNLTQCIWHVALCTCDSQGSEALYALCGWGGGSLRSGYRHLGLASLGAGIVLLGTSGGLSCPLCF